MVSTERSISCFPIAEPKRSVSLCLRFLPLGRVMTSLEFEMRRNSISSLVRATRVNSDTIIRYSLLSDLRNFLLAGMLKNRLRTAMLQPSGQAISVVSRTLPPDICTSAPVSSPLLRVLRVTSAQAAIEARASPRNPKVDRFWRSSTLSILDVACERKQSPASSEVIPQPLSITWMSVFP